VVPVRSSGRVTDVLSVVAVTVNGMLVGASLDHAVKQLPARHEIGVLAFAGYSAAADLGNGVAWYAGLGLTAATLAVATVVAAGRESRPHGSRSCGLSLLIAVGAAAAGWLVVSAVAAPLNFSQLTAGNDPVVLTRIFDRFAMLNLLHAALQLIAVVGLSAVVIARLGAVDRSIEHGRRDDQRPARVPRDLRDSRRARTEEAT
jgi:hypothetical protein